ncbi:hydrolase [Pseudomonas sp. sp1636]|uniref:hydrolase n=1 Tax=Pseudomonas sp. sp1636 TaxID=3036707 RepID=UPI0025A5A7FC|nr:hydrolase [Pseudomonas sp. sp1636]MDM8350139.1 hydrolase [Pseudomonas sp. sp1636]
MTRKLSIFLVALIVGACLLALLIWAERRPAAHYLSDLRSSISSEPAPVQARGNLLLIRPQLYPMDYQSPAHLRLKLAAALDNARNAGLLGPNTLVALPEHIGTWLLARGEKVEFYQARSRREVRDWLLLGNPLLAIEALLLNLDAERLDEALLRMKAGQMAEDYQQLFAGLAREYRVTLLAGSILLPEPRVEDGRLHSGAGPLRNLSLVFSPQGKIQGSPHLEPWPWRADAGPAQRLSVGALDFQVERDWRPGYPQSTVSLIDGRRSSPPLFLRGKLDWPIGGASRDILLIPREVEQASAAPGSHLLNIWIGAE